MSQASVTTREGGGRPAVGREHATSQNSRKAASTTSGGIRLAARPFARLAVRKGVRLFTAAASRAAVPRAVLSAIVEVAAITRPS